ncbi:MAG: hypothetical protein R2741_01665 [Methanolobus sp.]
MGVDERDYGKRNSSGNIDYSPKSPSTNIDDFLNLSYQEALEIADSDIKYCENCGKQIEVMLKQKKVKISTVIDGVVVKRFEMRTVKEYKSLICSTCSGSFCPDCVETSYIGKDTFVPRNICIRCQGKQKEETVKNCTHNYMKKFIRKDNNFDYYELECLKCGNKKGIDEPIKKIQHKPEPKTKTQPQPTSKKKGISGLLDSVKRIFK